MAKRVVDHKDQKIGNCKLEVSLYYEFLGRHETMIQLPEPEILTANLDILKFIKDIPQYKSDFEKNLDEIHANISWPDDLDKDDIKVMCTLDLTTSEGRKAVASWRQSVNQLVERFIRSMG